MIQQEEAHHLAPPTDSLSRTGLPGTLFPTVLPIELTGGQGRKRVQLASLQDGDGGGMEEGGSPAVSTRC